ncbi:NAD-dependent epimerase/dehydratase family protein [Sphingomonas lycopersici]|uniref:NAD-dependent epimerase/dehydratase family protein n=1 Tax=Sphingomonas lycopersici TaxID=2951807 RepID=A0AA42CW14_9SPHN|nr:NAD-dependent epimerase/dehydratase family protein [Sphingomonas lycopersici]
MKKAVVTGGGGFIGSYLVRRLVECGWNVVVVDNLARGRVERLQSVMDQLDWQQGDVRDPALMKTASMDADVIFHLAAVNGTENFYKQPELVLDVGLRGALAAMEGGRDAGVPDIVIASSAEVYQTPDKVPTDETVALTLPDSLNPRYSYGGSKIVSELIAFNYAREHYRKVQVFRPHNVYGPDMGWKHVLPQFIVRAKELIAQHPVGTVPFPIQGDGRETRAFCYVDDVVDGILTMYQHGSHREVYHIGNQEMVSIADLVHLVADYFERDFELVTGELAIGGTRVRCPDISKMAALGYQPSVALAEGVRRTADWYVRNSRPPRDNALL